METVIDRTSYRRNIQKEITKVKTKNNIFKIMFMNQTIAVMSIIIGVLSVKLMGLEEACSKADELLNSGMSFDALSSAVLATIKEVDEKFVGNVNDKKFLEELEIDISTQSEILEEKSGETVAQYETAVEGINQLAEDATIVKDKYKLILPTERNYNICVWMQS